MIFKKFATALFGLLALGFMVFACSRDEAVQPSNKQLVLPDSPYDYSIFNDEMAQLGRVLFYDKTLSLNNSTSCGSCHLQALAFTDARQFSKGFEGLEVSRNTPPIQNIGFNGQSLFWDGRETILESMVIMPILNHDEMGVFDEEQIEELVKSRSYYPELFEKAFESTAITTERISEALSAFVMSMESNGSKFDRNMSSITFGANNINSNFFNSLENKGMDLFFGKYNCNSCHNVLNPIGYNQSSQDLELVNVGLDMNYKDKGLGAISGNPEDNGRFKIPNLRNVAITGPYMHDGRFATLEEVIDHYSENVKNHPNLDTRLKNENGEAMVLHIPDEDKRALISFLKTLTDHQYINDVRFSDPFVSQ